jgi:hypothetical protein
VEEEDRAAFPAEGLVLDRVRVVDEVAPYPMGGLPGPVREHQLVVGLPLEEQKSVRGLVRVPGRGRARLGLACGYAGHALGSRREDMMISEYQQGLRDRFLSARVIDPPDPWRPVFAPWSPVPVGGLLGVGFGVDPTSGNDLLMVVSTQGHGVFDASTGVKIARDHEPEIEEPTGPDLSCTGIGPLAGTSVRIAGLFGGGLHTGTDDGWGIDVVSPDWPHHRVLLSTGRGPWQGSAGEQWWHVFHADYSELRAAGFSPSGRTLAVATSSDVMLWARPEPDH